jgi:hypothetical protein
MRMPDPRPFGETRLLAIVRAMCSADPLNVLDGGKVDAVLTVLTHRLLPRPLRRAFVMVSLQFAHAASSARSPAAALEKLHSPFVPLRLRARLECP